MTRPGGSTTTGGRTAGAAGQRLSRANGRHPAYPPSRARAPTRIRATLPRSSSRRWSASTAPPSAPSIPPAVASTSRKARPSSPSRSISRSSSCGSASSRLGGLRPRQPTAGSRSWATLRCRQSRRRRRQSRRRCRRRPHRHRHPRLRPPCRSRRSCRPRRLWRPASGASLPSRRALMGPATRAASSSVGSAAGLAAAMRLGGRNSGGLQLWGCAAAARSLRLASTARIGRR